MKQHKQGAAAHAASPVGSWQRAETGAELANSRTEDFWTCQGLSGPVGTSRALWKARYACWGGPLRGPVTSWPRRDADTRHKHQVPGCRYP